LRPQAPGPSPDKLFLSQLAELCASYFRPGTAFGAPGFFAAWT
jgi:hypothetical protein